MRSDYPQTRSHPGSRQPHSRTGLREQPRLYVHRSSEPGRRSGVPRIQPRSGDAQQRHRRHDDTTSERDSTQVLPQSEHRPQVSPPSHGHVGCLLRVVGRSVGARLGQLVRRLRPTHGDHQGERGRNRGERRHGRYGVQGTSPSGSHLCLRRRSSVPVLHPREHQRQYPVHGTRHQPAILSPSYH